MAKLKSSAKSRSEPKSAEGLQRSIMDSAQQIWHAGMGAFGRAQEEGTKLFETLVKEGSTLEQKTRRVATGKVDAVRDAVENRVGAVKERAADTWDRLEKVFEDRVQRALTRLGIPGRDDLQDLVSRVEELNAELRSLGARPAAAPGRSQPRTPARKAAPTPAKTARRAPAKTRKNIKDQTD
jgi:poly(hydroxyalkanoate) granule-associated protein